MTRRRRRPLRLGWGQALRRQRAECLATHPGQIDVPRGSRLVVGGARGGSKGAAPPHPSPVAVPSASERCPLRALPATPSDHGRPSSGAFPGSCVELVRGIRPDGAILFATEHGSGCLPHNGETPGRQVSVATTTLQGVPHADASQDIDPRATHSPRRIIWRAAGRRRRARRAAWPRAHGSPRCAPVGSSRPTPTPPGCASAKPSAKRSASKTSSPVTRERRGTQCADGSPPARRAIFGAVRNELRRAAL